MARSRVTIDLAAVRHNAGVLRSRLAGAELWAVVKADAYGHGAQDVAPHAIAGGASALCVATVGEALPLRRASPDVRILVMGPTTADDVARAREARLELVVADERIPEGVDVHVKLDTGMGRWGLAELRAPGRGVVGLMTHFAAADDDEAFTRAQLDRFLRATAPYAHLVRHAANSAAALTIPEARLDAARCGIALYGVDPFGESSARWGLHPVLRWESEIAATKVLGPGESTGYGRRFVAREATRIGLVPVGYADGFRRDMAGTRVLAAGVPCEVVGAVSMDVLAIRLDGEVDRGAPVTLVGPGATIESHAAVASTIGYEITCGIQARSGRSVRETRDD